MLFGLTGDVNTKLENLSRKYSGEKFWIPELVINGNGYYKEQIISVRGKFENEYYNEWKKYLINKNEEDIKNIHNKKYRFTFYSSKLVETVFNLCHLLNQPADVRYLAIDILDRFLVEHFFAVAEAFKVMENVNESEWKMIRKRLTNQSLLRILTCILIAAKHCSSCNSITVRTIQETMMYLKHPYSYSKRNVIKSEARIYETIDFNVSHRTPLLYVELFIEDLNKKRFFQRRLNNAYNFFVVCMQILDVAIIHHQEIYHNVLARSNVDHPVKKKKNFRVLKGDYLALAASVVYVASVLNGARLTFIRYLFHKSETFFLNHQRKRGMIYLGKEILKIISCN